MNKLKFERRETSNLGVVELHIQFVHGDADGYTTKQFDLEKFNPSLLIDGNEDELHKLEVLALGLSKEDDDKWYSLLDMLDDEWNEYIYELSDNLYKEYPYDMTCSDYKAEPQYFWFVIGDFYETDVVKIKK